MLEYEWFHGIDYEEMIRLVGQNLDERKMRLAACGYLRTAWDDFSEPQIRGVVEIAEDYADFRATRERVKDVKRALTLLLEQARSEQAREQADTTRQEWLVRYSAFLELDSRVRLLELVLKPGCVEVEALRTIASRVNKGGWYDDRMPTCNLLRCIFGNPFRPVTFSPSWRTDTALSLAQQMYESRDYSAMPILADALQDAGCESEDVLNHCRDASVTHIRGCWVVDLLLGKG
jgi:hypothetical protein